MKKTFFFHNPTLANILRHFGAGFWLEIWRKMGGYAKLQAFLMLSSLWNSRNMGKLHYFNWKNIISCSW